MATLTQQINTMMVAHQVWMDEQAFPNPMVHMWCGASLELDYSQGDKQMALRLTNFIRQHKAHERGEQCKEQTQQE